MANPAYPESAEWLPDHTRRMRAARERSAWAIGDPAWADVILAAYYDPESDHAALLEEMKP